MSDRIIRRQPDADGKLPSYFDPLTDPRWLHPREASMMRADDPVIGLEFDGKAWALPWWIMKNHHVANFDLDGRFVLVTLCEMCSSSGAFDPVIDGRRRLFRLAGVYNGTIMPTDVETGSLWTGFTGESIEGPLEGTVLPRLPVLLCTWGEWLELHPASRVPAGEGESRIGHGEGHSPGSPRVATSFRRLMNDTSGEVPHYELVLEAKAGGVSRCYPLSVLARRGPVLNDELGGEEIAVFSRPGSWLALAFSRDLDGRCLTFRNEAGRIVDEQTGSRWGISGVAESGPLEGRRLRYVRSGVEEFFISAAFNPGTRVYGSEGWRPGPAHDKWGLHLLPALITQMVKAGWWTREMPVLVTGCGDGLMAAWLAECGMDVTAIDMDGQAVEQARERFRGVVRLKFRTGDPSSPYAPRAQYAAVVDQGSFSRLKPEGRAAYARNLAAMTRPGANVMLLLPVVGTTLQQRAQRIGQLFGASFSALDTTPLELPDLATGGLVDGGVYRLKRR